MLLNTLTLSAAVPAAEETRTVVWNLYLFVCRTLGVEGTAVGGVIAVIAVLLCIASAYLIGSINPAIIISNKVYHEDIRSYGSGNAGATNILRTYGTKMALLIFGLDMLKAAIAVLLGSLIFTREIGGAIAAIFVVLGHSFPIYYKFKGGKGVSCTATCILILSPISFVILLALFILIATTTRFISLGSIMCALLFPLLAYSFGGLHSGFIPLAALIIGALVVFMHRENIKRLLAGKESKFSFKKTDKHAASEHGQSGEGSETAPEKTKEKTKERSFGEGDFVKCACGRLIPRSREKCVYCGEKNPAYLPKNEEKGGKKKKK